ncbi:hypothetical protein PIB30_079953 [Stylosanthes scabra]|uniref:Retrotransposon gag domain-containing protein n=1 Tax=Stylosanthes scabra TaxID=79078 RepID=A0ABU6WPJ4_9FABA|nr:hypothetical protein [Stylosanthes scabra]
MVYNSQGSDNHNHTQQTARTTTHVSNSIFGRPGEPNEEVTPFSDEIMAFRMPLNFTLSTTLKAYDGIGDPKVDVTKFRSMMLLNSASNPILCRAFPSFLDGAALLWFSSLSHESLRYYMTRFTKVAMEIPDLSADVHLHAIKSGLRPGKFQETIAVNKPKTLAKFREKA